MTPLKELEAEVEHIDNLDVLHEMKQDVDSLRSTIEDRIKKLESALREIAEANSVQAGPDKDMYRRWRRVATNAIDIARKALEGKDE